MRETPCSTAIYRLFGGVLLVLTLTGTAAAQEPLGEPAARDTLRPHDLFVDMQTHLERMLPVIRRMAISLQEALPELEPEGPVGPVGPDAAAVARRAARFTRAYYEALLVEGFTREEALLIVSGVHSPPGG